MLIFFLYYFCSLLSWKFHRSYWDASVEMKLLWLLHKRSLRWHIYLNFFWIIPVLCVKNFVYMSWCRFTKLCMRTEAVVCTLLLILQFYLLSVMCASLWWKSLLAGYVLCLCEYVYLYIYLYLYIFLSCYAATFILERYSTGSLDLLLSFKAEFVSRFIGLWTCLFSL